MDTQFLESLMPEEHRLRNELKNIPQHLVARFIGRSQAYVSAVLLGKIKASEEAERRLEEFVRHLRGNN